MEKGYCPDKDVAVSLNVNLCDYSYELKGAFGDKELKSHASLIDTLILNQFDDPLAVPIMDQNEFKKFEIVIFSNNTYMLKIDSSPQFSSGPKSFSHDFYSSSKLSKINLNDNKF